MNDQKEISPFTDSICYLKGALRKLSDEEITRSINAAYSMDLDVEEVQNILKVNKDLVKEYRKGGIKTLKKAIEIGTFSHATIFDRLLTLNEIVNLGKDGYLEEKATGKGEVVEVRTVNLSASLDALKIITQLMKPIDEEDMEDEEVTFRVVLDSD